LCEVFFFCCHIEIYNGIPVSGRGWRSIDKGLYIETRVPIKIPAGNSEFVGNFVTTRGNAIFRIRGITFSYSFEAGKKYIVSLETIKEGQVANVYTEEWAIVIFHEGKKENMPGDVIAIIPLGKIEF
jgi:hypothetical protein